jgi:2'-hydroxyisoflavone reductase
MKILVIGGTLFLGRHFVNIAMREGHELTTFNRGSTPLPGQTGVERLNGDRTVDLSALFNREWDVVVDTCGYEPGVVQKSAEVLRDKVRQYIFISSKSVYKDFSRPPVNEFSPLKPHSDNDYGSLKAQCEQVVNTVFGLRALVVRAGLIVGPYDQSDRFTYWPQRIQKGGAVLAPGRPERRVQFIDVRDLCQWIVYAMKHHISGTFNVSGPSFHLSMMQFLQSCVDEIKSNATLVWRSDDVLLNVGISPWVEMPLWIPDSMADMRYFTEVDCGKAFQNGLQCRPLDETIRDTLAWHNARGVVTTLRAGLDPAKEKTILDSA